MIGLHIIRVRTMQEQRRTRPGDRITGETDQALALAAQCIEIHPPLKTVIAANEILQQKGAQPAVTDALLAEPAVGFTAAGHVGYRQLSERVQQIAQKFTVRHRRHVH